MILKDLTVTSFETRVGVWWEEFQITITKTKFDGKRIPQKNPETSRSLVYLKQDEHQKFMPIVTVNLGCQLDYFEKSLED
jgi:hypothetical protein